MFINRLFKTLTAVTKYPSTHTCQEIASNSNSDPSYLAYLGEHPDTSVRRALADNEATPADTLCNLALDSDKTVREKVAEKIYTPAIALEILSEDIDKKISDTALYTRNRIKAVQALVAANNNTPEI